MLRYLIPTSNPLSVLSVEARKNPTLSFSLIQREKGRLPKAPPEGSYGMALISLASIPISVSSFLL